MGIRIEFTIFSYNDYWNSFGINVYLTFISQTGESMAPQSKPLTQLTQKYEIYFD